MKLEIDTFQEQHTLFKRMLYVYFNTALEILRIWDTTC